jgi:hypothetical protein
MKVAFKDKVRGVPQFPRSMDELRKVVSRKFAERNLLEEGDPNDLSQSRMSTLIGNDETL